MIDRLGPPGGDPAIDAPVDDRLGGAPANVACGLARLGTDVAFIGRLGTDAIGDRFARLFRQRGVDVGSVQWDAQRPSRTVLVSRGADGERQFQGFAGDEGRGFADQALTSVELPKQARWLLVGTLPLAAIASAASLRGAIAQAKARDIPLVVDVNWRPTFWDGAADPEAGPNQQSIEQIRLLLEQADLIKLACEEALWLFATADPAAIRAVLPQRPDIVVTDGAAPVTWCMADQAGDQPAFQPPQLVDTTGAGDAFTAGLLHRWSASPAERVRFAAACGALVCAGAGGIDPQPTEVQVEAFMGGVS